MRVYVNGEERKVEARTVGELLALLGAPDDGVAVAMDSEVIPRSRRAETPLHEGARVEVIRAVGGG